MARLVLQGEDSNERTTMDASKLLAAMSENHDGEVSAKWVSEHLGEFRLVDVREPHELTGPLGKIDEAENVPLLQVVGSAKAFDHETPVVLVCRSGRRSSQAAEVLRRAGVKAVASIEGGMLAWNLDVHRIGNVVQKERVANTQNLAEAIHHKGLVVSTGRRSGSMSLSGAHVVGKTPRHFDLLG